jgi:hypothetical protein
MLKMQMYLLNVSSLTLREERRLRVFENRELRGIFGPKRDEVTGEWRKLHNQMLYVGYLCYCIVAQVPYQVTLNT